MRHERAGHLILQIVIGLICLGLVTCNLTTQATPTPVPTATVTPAPTKTPTVTPTPTVDLSALDLLPIDLRLFIEWELYQRYGGDFRYIPRCGLEEGTPFYVFFETPTGSGQVYVAVWGVVNDMWVWLDTVPIEGGNELVPETRTY